VKELYKVLRPVGAPVVWSDRYKKWLFKTGDRAPGRHPVTVGDLVYVLGRKPYSTRDPPIPEDDTTLTIFYHFKSGGHYKTAFPDSLEKIEKIT